jgi:hypothetical protein
MGLEPAVSYYHAKKTAQAKQYLDERDRELAIKHVDERFQRSVAWLAKFRASGRASRTGFDWRPRWPLKPAGEQDAKETEAGDVVAHADAPGEGRGQGGQADRGGSAPQAGGEGSPLERDGDDFETPF